MPCKTNSKCKKGLETFSSYLTPCPTCTSPSSYHLWFPFQCWYNTPIQALQSQAPSQTNWDSVWAQKLSHTCRKTKTSFSFLHDHICQFIASLSLSLSFSLSGVSQQIKPSTRTQKIFRTHLETDWSKKGPYVAVTLHSSFPNSTLPPDSAVTRPYHHHHHLLLLLLLLIHPIRTPVPLHCWVGTHVPLVLQCRCNLNLKHLRNLDPDDCTVSRCWGRGLHSNHSLRVEDTVMDKRLSAMAKRIDMVVVVVLRVLMKNPKTFLLGRLIWRVVLDLPCCLFDESSLVRWVGRCSQEKQEEDHPYINENHWWDHHKSSSSFSFKQVKGRVGFYIFVLKRSTKKVI